MQNKMYLLFITLILIITSQDLISQFSKDTEIGLQAKFQTGLQQETAIQVPIWFGEKLSIAPSVSLVNICGSFTDIILAINPRLYMKKDIVSSYIGIYFGGAFFSTVKDEKTTDLFGALAIGGEYYLYSQFSIGIEAQLVATNSDKFSTRFGNPGGFNLNTAMAIIASVYF